MTAKYLLEISSHIFPTVQTCVLHPVPHRARRNLLLSQVAFLVGHFLASLSHSVPSSSTSGISDHLGEIKRTIYLQGAQ